MELTQIKYFLELAKREHISATADFLEISQPALSKSIMSLEKEIGVKLFDRKGKRIQLNQHGRYFLNYAQKALEDLNKGIVSAQHMRYEMMGEIKIVSTVNFTHIFHYLNAYLELNPTIKFNLSKYDLNGSDNQIKNSDFIICTNTDYSISYLKSNFWTEKHLANECLGILVSVNSPWCPSGENRSVSIKDLTNIPFIIETQKGGFHIDTTVKLCREAGFYPRICCETDDFLMRLQLIREGRGVSISTGRHLELVKSAYPDLLFFPILQDDCQLEIFLLHQKENQMSEIVLDFWEFIRDYDEIPQL